MFLLCIIDTLSEHENGEPWPGNAESIAFLGKWFETIKGSRVFYYILFNEFNR